MFEGFEKFTIRTESNPDIYIHGLKSGEPASSLPPLLLLHGFPQTLHIWSKVAPELSRHYTLVIPDLRGYGRSSKPKDLAAYAKSAMARDFTTVMTELGFDKFFICAHDRGARVAHKLCVDYPDRVIKTILLDICPTLAMYPTTNMEFAKAYWHWFFLIQNEPLPEMLITSKPRELAEQFMGKRQKDGISIFEPSCFEEYVRSLGDEETVHGMCQDYRASATLDLDEAREDLKNGRLIQCPLRVHWGKYGVIEAGFDAIKEWKAVSGESVTVEGSVMESGHYIPEHVPDDLIKSIVEFLK